jgi:calcineurin-like phosphoesterase family protein
MIYFTADLHLGHNNIIKYCNRPFDSVEEMDYTIIANWNSRVKENDVVYIIGDFAFKELSGYASRLIGIKYLILGSHDKINHVDSLFYERINLHILPPIWEIPISGLKDEYGKNRLIVLCHYSMRSWNKSHYCSYHLFGHHHGKLSPYGLSFDVGVDTNNFFPYSLNDVDNKMKTLKPIVDLRRK